MHTRNVRTLAWAAHLVSSCFLQPRLVEHFQQRQTHFDHGWFASLSHSVLSSTSLSTITALLIGITWAASLVTNQLAFRFRAPFWLNAFPFTLWFLTHWMANWWRRFANGVALCWSANNFAFRAAFHFAHVLRAANFTDWFQAFHCNGQNKGNQRSIDGRLVSKQAKDGEQHTGAFSAWNFFTLYVTAWTFTHWMTNCWANRIIAFPATTRMALCPNITQKTNRRTAQVRQQAAETTHKHTTETNSKC